MKHYKLNLALIFLLFFAVPAITFSAGTIDILIIAGGGQGGSAQNERGGGGGAGGYYENASYALAEGTYTIIVGSGGSGGANSTPGNNGGDSNFDTHTVYGGGGGAGGTYGTAYAGVAGGSGGGSASSTTVGGVTTLGEGNIGGNGYTYNYGTRDSGGGGGGAGGAGGAGGYYNGGNGGIGISSSITGSAIGRAGGGAGTSALGGGTNSDGGGANHGGNATNDTGGGGGGYGGYSGQVGGAGGSGIVIIAYPTSNAGDYTCNGTITTSGGNTICTYLLADSGKTFIYSATTTIYSATTTYALASQIAGTQNTFYETSGFDIGALASTTGNGLFALFTGNILALIYGFRVWIVALLTVGAVLYLSVGAFRFFRH